eukprot:XP_001705166.1 Hypothetical protein GL50803_31437 [Giardia lamblia ATCC 50803]
MCNSEWSLNPNIPAEIAYVGIPLLEVYEALDAKHGIEDIIWHGTTEYLLKGKGKVCDTLCARYVPRHIIKVREMVRHGFVACEGLSICVGVFIVIWHKTDHVNQLRYNLVHSQINSIAGPLLCLLDQTYLDIIDR